MGITGDECEEILRARGREVNRPPIEEPEVVLPPRNETRVVVTVIREKNGADILEKPMEIIM